MATIDKQVSILGTKYLIRYVSEKEYPKLKKADASGLAELYQKELIINKDTMEEEDTTYANLESYKNKVVRHEIVHAFFHEAGLLNYCTDEKLVDWIAIQINKMYKVMDEVDAID